MLKGAVGKEDFGLAFHTQILGRKLGWGGGER